MFAASARRCCNASCRPSGRSRSCPATSIEHALLGLAAMYVGIPYAPISPAYSLISQDFGKLRSIIGLLTPGLVFAADGEPYRRAIEAVVPPGVEVVVGRNPLPGRPTHAAADIAGDAHDFGGRHGARRGRAGHRRQVPVHLGLDRHAESGDQHPAHVVLEPGDDPLAACVLRRRPAGDRGLVALAPHRRRQPQFRLRALQRRHHVHRRGQAGAGR